MKNENGTKPSEGSGDAIARSKRILALVDAYVEKPTGDNRHTLRCALHEEFTAALAQPAEPGGGGGEWQPIETAPKHGLIDVLVDGSRRFSGCHYDKICGEWRHITACGVLVLLRNATHWMPIPAPPSTNSAEWSAK